MSTIVAISTAPGVGGIGIIRISGKNTFDVIKKIFLQKKNTQIQKIKTHTIKYGHIINPKNNELIDEVLVSYFRAPKSYTTENMCEINCHGGSVTIQKILKVCLENGANMAEPGEFTKRAFLNGRIDLSQAEAIIDVINAKTEKESKASINQLEGFLSKKIQEIKTDILSVLVDIEASIDYPEYDIEEVLNENVIEALDRAKEKLLKLEKSFETGKIIKEGIKTAIIGRPNAGKSSLLNAILKEERAIVTEFEGTTRDTIEEFITIEGIPLKIIDTAGIRDAKDEVEKIGIKKSIEIANDAELVIAIFDSSKELNEEDIKILELIKNKNTIIVLNKMDLKPQITKGNEKILETNKTVIEISALNKTGIEELYNEISNMFGLNKIEVDNSEIITNIRHKNLVNQAIQNLDKSMQAINNNMPIDIISIDMQDILNSLGEITGESVSENIINEIFAKFCLGK